jgi:hypothetical protein
MTSNQTVQSARAGKLTEMLAEYFALPEPDVLRGLSSFLHLMKYGGTDEILHELSDVPLDICPNSHRLAFLAASVEYWFLRHGLDFPMWVYDERTIAEPPYLGLVTRPEIIHFCGQHCLAHDVIVEDSFFEVL